MWSQPILSRSALQGEGLHMPGASMQPALSLMQAGYIKQRADLSTPQSPAGIPGTVWRL